MAPAAGGRAGAAGVTPGTAVAVRPPGAGAVVGPPGGAVVVPLGAVVAGGAVVDVVEVLLVAEDELGVRLDQVRRGAGGATEDVA